VNAGGTGSLETSAAESWVTEVTAGSGFYSSGLFDSYTNFHHRPAAAFAVEIVRQPKEGMFTCLGGGYIASGEVGVAKQPKPYLPDGMKLVAQEGCGEVQTPFFYSGQEAIGVGDPVFFRHAKAGELCERFNSLYLVQNGKIEEEVKTYRGEGECYL
jgi:D-serine deaminase-like pyridoxal phosphate-dependent protein